MISLTSCRRAVAWLAMLSFVTLLGPVAADSGPEHQVRQTLPIQLGSSGGSEDDISSLYCCGGTLGALVQNASGLYILSNNHVIARSNLATIGETIIHPGLIDINCGSGAHDAVGSLIDFVPILYSKGRNVPLNEVDAAIALVVDGAVSPDGAILDVGPVSPNLLTATVGLGVQKSGRTTGQTFGTVQAIGVTVDVGYSESCGGPAKNVARFVNQIRIGSGSFSAGGDSGSLVVEHGSVDPATGLPRPVGLLFAGSSTSTLANPIDRVADLLGVTFVSGTPPPPPATGSIAGTVTRAADGLPIAGANVSTDTGQSAQSAGDGSYSIANVPVGSRTVTATAAGYTSQAANVEVAEDATSTADFALEAVTVASHAIVECVTYTTSGGKNQEKDMTITIAVRDDLGNPVAGAVVDISITLNGSAFGTGTGATTDSNGNAAYRVRNAANGTYVTTVTGVTSALVFEGSTPDNMFRKGTDAVPDADCRGDAPQPSSGSDVARAVRIKAANEKALFAHEGVVGTGVSVDAAGRPVIEIYLDRERPATRAALPARVQDLPTRVVVTGPFEAY